MPKPKLDWDDGQPIVPPPETVTVSDRKILLYLPDGKAVVRKIGFSA